MIFIILTLSSFNNNIAHPRQFVFLNVNFVFEDTWLNKLICFKNWDDLFFSLKSWKQFYFFSRSNHDHWFVVRNHTL